MVLEMCLCKASNGNDGLEWQREEIDAIAEGDYEQACRLHSGRYDNVEQSKKKT